MALLLLSKNARPTGWFNCQSVRPADELFNQNNSNTNCDDGKKHHNALFGWRILRPAFHFEKPKYVHLRSTLELNLADIRQVAVALRIVDSITDNKFIGDIKADPCCLNIDLAPLCFVE